MIFCCPISDVDSGVAVPVHGLSVGASERNEGVVDSGGEFKRGVRGVNGFPEIGQTGNNVVPRRCDIPFGQLAGCAPSPREIEDGWNDNNPEEQNRQNS